MVSIYSRVSAIAAQLTLLSVFYFGISHFLPADVSFEIVDQKGNPVVDAVIWSSGGEKPQPTEVSIPQKKRQFEKEVTVVTVGSKVRFPNLDTVQHHVYSFSPAKTFDIPLYSGDAPAPITLDRPGVVTLGCNIHDWMVAYILVLDTSGYIRTGQDGKAILKGLSPGASFQIWHPRLKGGPAQGKAEGTTRMELSLKPAINRRPLDAGPGSY